jgi:hypothetical protein
MIAHGFNGSPARAGVVRVGVVEPWVAWERESSPPGTTQGFSPGRRCVVPGALGLFTQAFPTMKRWAFLSRPAWRDSRVSDSSLSATSNGVRGEILLPRLGLSPFIHNVGLCTLGETGTTRAPRTQARTLLWHSIWRRSRAHSLLRPVKV